MEHGQIIERENYEELMAENGEYYQLYTGAFELEEVCIGPKKRW